MSTLTVFLAYSMQQLMGASTTNLLTFPLAANMKDQSWYPAKPTANTHIAEAGDHSAHHKAQMITIHPEDRDDPRLLMHSNSCTPVKYYRINTWSCYTYETQLLIYLNRSQSIPTAALYLLQVSARTANSCN